MPSDYTTGAFVTPVQNLGGVMLKRFLRCRAGGVAPLMAFAAVPLFAAIGASIDFTRAASVRAGMQNALDAAALIVSKDSSSDSALNDRASNLFNSNFANADAQNVQVTV